MRAPENVCTLPERKAPEQCVHCGLPLPAQPILGKKPEELFCCRGCRMAYAILQDTGLGKGYYALRERLGESGQRVEEVGDLGGYAFFSDPSFEERYTEAAGEGLRRVEFYLEGIHCAACVWVVERLALQIGGIRGAELNLSENRLCITYDPKAQPLEILGRRLASVGYAPHPARGAQEEEIARKERHKLLIRIGVAAACGGNIMLFSSALYAGDYQGIESRFANLFPWASLGLSLPVVFYSATPFFRSAIGGLRAGSLHMDVPIALGIVVAFLSSCWNVFTGTGHVWFDTLSMLVFLLLIGRLLLETGKRRAALAARSLFALVPRTAFLLSEIGAEPRRVSIETVAEGDLLFVPPGDCIPVDGTVEDGRSHVDESLLTGESAPARRGAGQEVWAGTSVVDGALTIRARATGDETRLARLSRLVEDAARRRAPIVATADRIAAWFVAVVLGAACLTFIWWWSAGFDVALSNAIALLVVSCPCALGLATPFALSVAMGRGARSGILIKGGEAIERLARVRHLFLDKTGTLTQGRPQVIESTLFDENAESLLPLVSAAEQRSSHPVARAIAAHVPPAAAKVEDFHQEPGRGIRARVGAREVLAGNAAWLAEHGLALTDAQHAALAVRETECAAASILLAVDGRLIGALLIADGIRSDARETTAAMRERGLKLELLSGDAEAPVRAVAGELAIARWHASVSPEQKRELVAEASGEELVGMVGDGLNDTAALAAAGVGIAVHGGSEAAFEAADVATARAGLAPVLEAVNLARKAMGRVRLNLGFSLFYNVITGTLAATGHITPLWAAVLMPLSSLTVIGLSFKK